jgi:hypothetical protein
MTINDSVANDKIFVYYSIQYNKHQILFLK